MIDLSFEIAGDRIPLDHGYALFSALSRVAPKLHGNRDVGVHPIRGARLGPRVLTLVAGSRLRLRLRPEDLVSYIGLAGACLDLEGHELRVGIPRVDQLVPAAALASRLVTIKGMREVESFRSAVRRHLDEAAIAASPVLSPAPDEGGPARRVLRIKGRRVVGFSLRVAGLTADESLRLQERGLGGRRRMGCGLFVPYVSRSHPFQETTRPSGEEA